MKETKSMLVVMLVLAALGLSGCGRGAPASEVGVPAVVTPLNVTPPSSFLDVDQTIKLLNPASGTTFSPTDTITFDWSYPVALAEDERFAVYLYSQEESKLVGVVTNPIVLTVYRVEAVGSAIKTAVNDYEWQVVLESISSGEPLSQSERHALHFTAAQATASPIAPTATATLDATPAPTRVGTTATATARATATATATPTVTTACILERPSNWVRYTIQPGDALSPLAVERGTTVEYLLLINCLSSNLLSVSQRIWLPPLPPTATPDVPPTSPPSSPQPTAPPASSPPPPPPDDNPPPPPPPPTAPPPTQPAPTEPPPIPSSTPPPPPTP